MCSQQLYTGLEFSQQLSCAQETDQIDVTHADGSALDPEKPLPAMCINMLDLLDPPRVGKLCFYKSQC